MVVLQTETLRVPHAFTWSQVDKVKVTEMNFTGMSTHKDRFGLPFII